MACLGAVAYDPSTAVTTKATSAALAMTAFDTTNARITFTAPANGKVLVRVKATNHGATTTPRVLLGVLDGATVRGRMSPMGQDVAGAATTHRALEATFLVTGLTPTTSYTFDAAYGVETTVAATNFKYGGPNNTTTNDAWGALEFEVWETGTLLAGTLYDPAVAVSKVLTSLLAMTAFDTTNLRHTITAPTSGRVFWRISTIHHGSATVAMPLLGILDGATVRARSSALQNRPTAGSAVAAFNHEASGVISGLTGGNSYTLDAAYGVEIVGGAGSAFKYGGPNDATTENAFGGIAFELWSA